MTRAQRLALVGAGAVVGAGAFVRARVQAEHDRHPARGRFVNGLHYVEAGFGPSMVLLHGLGSMLEDFELSGVVEQAAKQYRVVAFDRPGYGYSSRPRRGPTTPFAQAQLLHAAFEKLGIAQPVIVGHSLGTLVAIAYALQYPGHLRGLVLASGYYFPTVRPDAPLLIPPAIPLIGAVMRHTISPLVGRLLWPVWLKVLFSPMPVPGYFARFPTWRALQPGQLHTVGLESAMLLPVTMRMKEEYGKIDVPTAIVAGTDDRYVRTASHSQRLHEALPHSTFISVPGAGHMVHHAAPEAILAAIAAVQ